MAVKLILLYIFIIALNIGISIVSATYWNKVSIGLKYVPMYFYGMFVAFESKRWEDSRFDNRLLKIIVLFICLLYILLFRILNLQLLYMGTLVKTSFYIILICSLLSILEHFSFSYLLKVLKWLGKYTLELYILHLFIRGPIISIFHFGQSISMIVSVLISVVVCAPVHYVFDWIIVKMKGYIL